MVLSSKFDDIWDLTATVVARSRQPPEMPLGIQRLNQRRQHPNDRIIFIKPLPGPSQDTAIDFLNRIAAVCAPIMRANHLSVMSLEEHEPNPEFVGRNFNAGEIIQLVLKAPGSGRWLSFRYVQMVMMHELAHCKQMNHSRAFWDVRNGYAEELRTLWGKNYTGDGLWGKGQSLYSGQYTEAAMPDASIMPQHLCGGTYRSRGRKRKRGTNDKPKQSYAERKQKWIAKKFGAGGEALGTDEGLRIAMERGKVGPKPRVAKSKRGRDLRAEAALLRFSQQKDAQQAERESTVDESDEETDYEDDGIFDGEDAVDTGGGELHDLKGRGLVKVCEDEDIEASADAQRELAELTQIGFGNSTGELADRKNHFALAKDLKKSPEVVDEDDRSTDDEQETHSSGRASPKSSNGKRRASSTTTMSDNDAEMSSHPPVDSAPKEYARSRQPAASAPVQRPENKGTSGPQLSVNDTPIAVALSSTPAPDPSPTASNLPHPIPQGNPELLKDTGQDLLEYGPGTHITHLHTPPTAAQITIPTDVADPNQPCAICSLDNPPNALTCIACAHVLDTDRLTRFWRCMSSACQGSEYVNAEDAGVCALCGQSKG